MDYPSKIICYPVSRRIFSVERILVKVEHRNHRSRYCPDPAAYMYSKAAPRKMSVYQWANTRFNKCFPQLKATVIDSELNRIPVGTQLLDAEHEPIDEYLSQSFDFVYFSNLIASIEFRSDRFAKEAKVQLNRDRIITSSEYSSFLFWKTYIIRLDMKRAVLTGEQSAQLQKYLDEVAVKYCGILYFRWGEEQLLDVPFDLKNVGTGPQDLLGIVQQF